MRQIYKWNLHSRITKIDTHEGAKCVLVAMQGNKITVWLEFDPMRPRTQITFQIVATGPGEIGEGMVHQGSVIADPYVWHVYRWPNG